MKDPLSDYNKIALVQSHQVNAAQSVITNGITTLNDLEQRQKIISKQVDEFDELVALAQEQVETLKQHPGFSDVYSLDRCLDVNADILEHSAFLEQEAGLPSCLIFEKLKTIDPGCTDNDFLKNVSCYAEQFDINLSQSAIFNVLSEQERQEVNRRIYDDLTHKNACCDHYDYMIAGTCGVVGGLIDIFFVGIPGISSSTNFGDKIVDISVQRFATFFGWKGDSLKGPFGAIAFLEKRFKINYDQQYGAATNDLLGMNTKNHHLKSIGHWPDFVGLFFSILDQFNSTSHFVDNGRLLTFNTETFELSGETFLAKIFAGFVNWIGHLFSDAAGSSAAQGRGAGIPIPFFGFSQLLSFGSIGKAKKTIADIAVELFEKGYDLRHGIAMSIPLITTEILVRFMWSIKAHFYHLKKWSESIPSGDIPELRRMLLVGHGTLCLLDGLDATLRSGGEIVTMLLRMNLIAWVRLGFISMKELQAVFKCGHLDQSKVNIYLQSEYERLIA
ncbi:hypothetical protein [Megalodesulfovibrio paquesii]